MQTTSRSSLDCALHPKNIAVLGASNRPLSRGSFIWKAVAGSSLLPNAWPINPKYKYIGERPCLPSIKEVPEVLDLAVISLRADRITKALSDVCQHGVRAVLITPDEQQYSCDPLWLKKLQQIASHYNVRLIGPDSLGFMNPNAAINASYWPTLAKPGNIALISQSGMIAGAFVDYAQETELGFSGLINTGAAIDIDLPELIDYYANHSETRVIAIHLEGLRHPRLFFSAIRAAARKKHVVILKAGTDPHFAADRLASFKLGSDAGRHDAFVAMVRRAGAILIESFEEFTAAVTAFSSNRLPRGNRLAVIANGSGFAALAATAVNEQVDLHGLSNETITALQRAFPSSQIAVNPINVGTTAPTERYEKTLQLILQDPMIDGAVVVVAPGPVQSIQQTLNSLVKTASTSFKPVISAWIGDRATRHARHQLLGLSNAPISAVRSPVVAARAFGYLAQRTYLLERMHDEPDSWKPDTSHAIHHARNIIRFARQNERHLLQVAETSLLLEKFGISTAPFLIAHSLPEAKNHAQQLGFPVVMKAIVPGRDHQSEMNGVHLHLHTENDITQAWDHIKTSTESVIPPTQFSGVIIQKMIPHHALREMHLSITVDHVLGPVIEFGVGGLGAGLYKEQSVALPPLTLNDARRFIQDSHISQTFGDFRGLPPVNTESLAKMACILSVIAENIPAVQTLSLDPLVWTPQGLIVLDASIRLSDKPLEAERTYNHLTICPAPKQNTQRLQTKNGTLILRALEEEDYSEYRAFLTRLSGKSLYFRFQTSTQLPIERIVELCQVDYTRESAWALVDSNGAIHGAARWKTTNTPQEAEFGIAIEDTWQGQGLARPLMEAIEQSALNLGKRRLIAYVLPNNETMHGILTHFGFIQQDASTWIKLLSNNFEIL